MSKREPLGERCTPIRQGNGTYFVQMRRSSASRPHRDGEYFGNGRFTVERRPVGDIVRAALAEDEEVAAAARNPVWTPLVTALLTADVPGAGDVDVLWYFDAPGTYTNPYGSGHEFWLVITMNGTDVLPSEYPTRLIPPGATGQDVLNFPSGTLVTVVVTVYYDSSLTYIVATATETTTTA